MKNFVIISETNTNYVQALKGRWFKEWGTDYSMNVFRDIGVIVSDVMTEAKTFSVTLPACYDFYAQILGASGVRTYKVTDGKISVALSAGEMLTGTFRCSQRSEAK